MIHPIDRRSFVLGAGALGALALTYPRSLRAEIPAATRAALEQSKLVYVSPLLANGKESSCHGEVWYFADQGDVVLATAADGWKSRAVKSGRNRARLWFGDLGRYKGDRELVAKAPSVDARASFDEDPATFERLLAAYGKRYADEWGKWEPRFRESRKSGERLVIRYRPES